MPRLPMVTDNEVSDTLPDGVAWVSHPSRHRTLECINATIAWCESQGLNAHHIPMHDGLTIRVASPDGGLIATVTEYELTPGGLVARGPGGAMRGSTRTVPVESIPPVGGLIPPWAAQLTGATR